MSTAEAEGSLGMLGPIGPLQRRLRDVREYQIPRLRQCASVPLARDLAAEARSDLEAVRSALEEAHEEAESLPLRERDNVAAAVAALEQEYAATHAEYRAAIVAAKKASVAAARKHELLEPVEDVPRAETSTVVSGDDALQTKTNEVTDALRRTTQMLQTELERSVLSTQMLKESSNTMRTTQSLYDNYTALLTTSGQLVRAIERADWWDRALIAAAFTCFLLTVLWIIKQRVVNRVGGAAVWWVGGSFKLLRYGLGGGGSKAVKDAATAAGGAAVAAGAASSAAAAAAAAASEKAKQAKAKVKDAVKDVPVKNVPIDADSAVKPAQEEKPEVVDSAPEPEPEAKADDAVTSADPGSANEPARRAEGLAKGKVVDAGAREADTAGSPVEPAQQAAPEAKIVDGGFKAPAVGEVVDGGAAQNTLDPEDIEVIESVPRARPREEL